jgi:Leucine-rich repeat (LRR) protein
MPLCNEKESRTSTSICHTFFLSKFKLPPSIFSCKTLVVLRLTGIQLHDLSHVVVDLPRLKTLHFSTHQINIPLYFSPKPFQRFDYLSKLLIGCPAIEEFHAPLV